MNKNNLVGFSYNSMDNSTLRVDNVGGMSGVTVAKKYLAVMVIMVTTVLMSSFTITTENIVDEISAAIRTGNSKELATYFNNNIDVTLPGYSGNYSKAQAEIIVKDFFRKYPPTSFNVIHQGASNDGSQYTIGNMGGATQFKVYFLLKKFGEKQLIQQLRFEN